MLGRIQIFFILLLDELIFSVQSNEILVDSLLIETELRGWGWVQSDWSNSRCNGEFVREEWEVLLWSGAEIDIFVFRSNYMRPHKSQPKMVPVKFVNSISRPTPALQVLLMLAAAIWNVKRFMQFKIENNRIEFIGVSIIRGLWVCVCDPIIHRAQNKQEFATYETQHEFVETWMNEALHSFKQNEKYIEQQTNARQRPRRRRHRTIGSRPKKRSHSKWNVLRIRLRIEKRTTQFLIEWMTTVYCDGCFISRMAHRLIRHKKK